MTRSSSTPAAALSVLGLVLLTGCSPLGLVTFGMLDFSSHSVAGATAPTTSYSYGVAAAPPSAGLLELGDCFDQSEDEDDIAVVPCEDEHENEVYAVFDLSGGAYPGDENVDAYAFDGCDEAFAPFIGRAWEDSLADYWYFTPSEDGWASGDRQVVCAVYDLKRWTTTGTLKGSGR